MIGRTARMRSRLAPLLRTAFLALVVLMTLTATGGAARADDPPKPRRRDEVYWHDEWPKFTFSEALISIGVTARNFDFEKALDGPREALVEFYVPLLDKEARSLFRPDSASTRQAYARLSDIGFRTLVFAPYAIDVGLTLAVHRNPEVAAQLFLIDFEVLTLAGATQVLVSRLIGRARPYVGGENPCKPGLPCEGGPYRSLLSGHTMAAFTAAGLMCAHHENLPIFGGGAADTWACIWAVSVASATGMFRIPADEHWASDVLLGAGVGWLYGYYLPKLLHFQKPRGSRLTDFTWMPALFPHEDGGVLSISGRF